MCAQRTHRPDALRPGVEAVLIDAMGTLITFEPPAPHLAVALRAVTGVEVPEAVARAAIRDEIRHYRAHMHLGGTLAGLAELRAGSAEAMRPALGDLAADLSPEVLETVLMASLRFVAFPESAGVLRDLRAAGLTLVVVSNWDASLHERLVETGLADLVDAAFASAELGSAKPDGAIFAAALARAGVGPQAAVHVGDDVANDVRGALDAGIAPVLVDRGGTAGGVPPGVPIVRTLGELGPLLGIL